MSVSLVTYSKKQGLPSFEKCFDDMVIERITDYCENTPYPEKRVEINDGMSKYYAQLREALADNEPAKKALFELDSLIGKLEVDTQETFYKLGLKDGQELKVLLE